MKTIILLREGGRGRIIATDLFNYNMPFIRYETGDHGYISGETCPCGLGLPRIYITGRYSSYLTFPSRRIHHLEFDGAMDGFMDEVFQYQIAKKSDTKIVARIIPGPAFVPATRNKIQKNLEELTGNTVTVSTVLVKDLPLTPRGKSRIVADESENSAQ